MKYPKEAPVFSLREEWNEYWPKGAIVDLCGFNDEPNSITPFTVVYCKYGNCGYIGESGLSNLLPLTPAAREMLAIAKASR